MSALTLRFSPESEVDEQTPKTSLRAKIFGLLGDNPKAHENGRSRAQFIALLEKYTKTEALDESDPLFSIARNYFGLKDYKIILVGSASVGKSAYVEKLKTNRFISKYSPTENTEVTSVVLNTNHFPIKIDVWDIAGTTTFEGYFVGANAAILMYDVSSKQPMKGLTEYYQSLVRVCEGIPTVFVGNKAESNSKRKLRKDDIVTFRRKNKLQVRICIDVIFSWMFLSDTCSLLL